jgi:hypothetical protein
LSGSPAAQSAPTHDAARPAPARVQHAAPCQRLGRFPKAGDCLDAEARSPDADLWPDASPIGLALRRAADFRRSVDEERSPPPVAEVPFSGVLWVAGAQALVGTETATRIRHALT